MGVLCVIATEEPLGAVERILPEREAVARSRRLPVVLAIATKTSHSVSSPLLYVPFCTTLKNSADMNPHTPSWMT